MGKAGLTRGKPIGSYEVWAEWCRDPLFSLGARDPVERLAAVKAADPKRKRILAVFEAWWKAHRSEQRVAKELDQSVIQEIDEKAGTNRDGEFRYNRQYVARWLQRHVDTRVGGYVLTSIPVGPPSQPVHHYSLMFTEDGCLL